MQNNKELIETLYTAFQKRDFKTMANCYHSEAYFKDEAFELKGKEIGAMWQMLCERGKDLDIIFTVSEKNHEITAHWEAKYTFSQTGRSVYNIIDAEFEFKDDKIFKHLDHFNFWNWSKQALGLPGLLLGWSPFLKSKVKQSAKQSLDSFISQH